ASPHRLPFVNHEKARSAAAERSKSIPPSPTPGGSLLPPGHFNCQRPTASALAPGGETKLLGRRRLARLINRRIRLTLSLWFFGVQAHFLEARFETHHRMKLPKQSAVRGDRT